MRLIWLLAVFLVLVGCMTTNIHNQSDMFIDIEVRKEDAWIGCSDINLKAENSLMTLYALHKGRVYEFMFRRVLSVKRCMKIEEIYRKLAEDALTVRIVGIHHLESDGGLITSRVPQKFKEQKNMGTWTFIRFSTAKGCESYFEGDCKPENYWGGVLPSKKSNLAR
ncbi:MAG: hypothetical protein KDD50_07460 [Bdellovibrionales bacterium]|nr:hypothetical protein [Bdellovibrionales bacterium]